jgi:hypothetical protein
MAVGAPRAGAARENAGLEQAPRLAAPLLGLQRRAGNRAVGALLARRGMLQRAPADDLRGGASVRVSQGEKVDLPAGTALVDVNGQRYRIPSRVYEIKDVPAELDGLSFDARTYRGVYLPGSEIEQLQELKRSGTQLTIGEVRAHAARTGESVRVAIGMHEGKLQLLGVDSFKGPKKPGGLATSGFVVTGLNTRIAGRDLFVARARVLMQEGASAMWITVGSSADTLAYHQELVNASKIGKVALDQGKSYSLGARHLANVLAEWDRSLSPEQRTALRAVGAVDTTKAADVRAALATPSAPAPPAAAQPATKPPETQKPTAPGAEETAPPSGHETQPRNLAAEELERQSARGQAVGGAAIVAIAALQEWLNRKVEESQRALIRAELDDMGRQVAEHQKLFPKDGALIRVVYTRMQLPDAPASGPAVFGWVDAGYGPTESQAANELYRQAKLTRTLGRFEHYEHQFQWVKPLAPTPYTELHAPFSRVGSGGIAGTTLTLQNVKWDWDGFDDEQTSTITFKSPEDAQFSICLPGTPKSGRYLVGATDIPVRMSRPKEGAAVAAINLDPDIPFSSVSVVPIFPENDATRDAFKSARKLKLEWPSELARRPNIDLVRFVRPENIRVLSTR